MKVLAWLLLALCIGQAGGDTRRSGFDEMNAATQAMQSDDSQNPAMLWVADGESLWQRHCASCHGQAEKSMRGASARHPAFDPLVKAPVDLAGRIRACQSLRAREAPFAYESRELLALEAYVALQSRGLPLAPPRDPRLDSARAQGERLFRLRIGQLDLSCAQCHEGQAGRRLGGSVIPQGHATGYPIYRLEWQGVGSLQRRLRGCMSGVRAEPYAYGAAELVALEVYLAERAAGMASEAPAVRP